MLSLDGGFFAARISSVNFLTQPNHQSFDNIDLTVAHRLCYIDSHERFTFFRTAAVFPIKVQKVGAH